MKSLRYLIAGCLAIFVLLLPLVGLAADKEVKAALSLNGVVPSNVDISATSANLSTPQVLADSSQDAVVSTLVKDKGSAVIAGVNVMAYSNRGAIDHIVAVDANGAELSRAPFGISVALAATQTVDGNTGTVTQTDKDGRAYFKVTSDVPGEAIITIVADNLVKVADFKVTFLPMPFPKDVTFSLALPKIFGTIIPTYNQKQGTVTLIAPKSKENSTPSSKMVNLGVELRIPFWVTSLVFFLMILTPFMIHFIYASLKAIRKTQLEEKTMILAEAEDIKKEKEIIQATKNEVDALHKQGPSV